MAEKRELMIFVMLFIIY